MNGEKPDENFSLLKVELEEAKKIEYILKQQLSEKKLKCESLEEEIDSDSSCENKVNDFMLMAMGDFDDEHTGGEMDDEEAVVDMEGELISSLEEIDRLKCKKRKQKGLLMQFK